MPELRQSRATKDWVIVARERAMRPQDFVRSSPRNHLPEHDSTCPFCPDNEHMTPPEIFAFRSGLSESNTKGWRLRIISNKYAALVPSGSRKREAVDDFYRRMDGFGAHEVIIETPQHNLSFATMSATQAEEVFLAYRERYHELRKDGRFSIVIIFRNHGVRAGTSLEHPHSQLIATPIVPTHIRQLLEEAMRYYDDHGTCVFCDTSATELRTRDRLVLETKNFVAYEPFASSVPFETTVISKRHTACFGSISEREAREAANVTQSILQTIHLKLGDPDFNLVIRTAPFSDENEEYYHWYIQIYPRLTTIAGFELGSGINITTALPEETAKFLRITKLHPK
ncbi:MAG: galactose-1-phosphate uridylyltransferase [Bacteroidota bacterium]